MKALKKSIRILLVTAFWIGVWALAAWGVGKPLLLPSPAAVAVKLWELMQTANFYLVTLNSLSNVAVGILFAILGGTLFALLTHRCKPLKELIFPLMTVIKSTPVAS